MGESGRVTGCFATLETTFNFKPFVYDRSDDYIVETSPRARGRVALRRIAFWILSFRSLVGDICRRIIKIVPIPCPPFRRSPRTPYRVTRRTIRYCTQRWVSGGNAVGLSGEGVRRELPSAGGHVCPFDSTCTGTNMAPNQ